MAIERFFNPFDFGIDLLFTIIAVVSCFLIYFKTKESYELTKYEGIRYFRQAFLFFGLSYLFRFALSIVVFSRIAFDVFIPRTMFLPLFILLIGYFSTTGIFYLIFGSIWHKFDSKKLLIFGHGTAIILSIISFFTRSHLILIYLQCLLLIIAIVLNFIISRQGRKISRIKVLYALVAVLWLINLLIIDR